MATELTLSSGTGPDGAVILTLAGEIDMSNSGVFADALTEAVTDAGGSRLVIDLTAVRYLDSAGLAALFTHADHIEVRTGQLLVPLLEISGLSELTTVHHA